MCGIVGKFNFDRARPVSPALLRSMLQTIRHRGPDDDGLRLGNGIGLGHCRLSILDLSSGHQPLSNEDGSVWLVFNGEIYNYRELRRCLLKQGHEFRTESDSEVIVHLYEERGQHCVEQLRGMFAFALWDQRREQLLLARDRVGIKPLYYWLSERCLIFASEIKAILADPEVTPEVMPSAVGRFFTFGYVPGSATLLRNLCKLPPASCMLVKNGETHIQRYWDLAFHPVQRRLREATSELLSLLQETVRLHMLSDVPLGFLLSGGIDSTSILALAAQTGISLRTYTIGFSAPGVPDERPYAARAATAYGAEHHEATITAREFQDLLPRCVWHMEEPVCEPPAVALYCVSRLAAGSVKVLLSGEGADEAFAGYPNYRNVFWLERFKSLSSPVSRALGSAVLLANRIILSQRLARSAPLLRVPFDSYYYSRSSTPFRCFNGFGDRIYSPDLASAMAEDDPLQPLRDCLSHAPGHVLNRMLYLDLRTWLPDDLLLKADKMTMANSVELRVPFLDHRVLEFAASLPLEFKIRGLTTKYLLRHALGRLLPPAILQRKKAGFPVPYVPWLRYDLRDFLADVLLDSGSSVRGYFRPHVIEAFLAENSRSGRFAREVFSLTVLELWHRQFLRPAAWRVHQPSPLPVEARPLAA